MIVRKLMLTVFIGVGAFSANAQNTGLKSDVNWQGLTAFPEVEENSVEKQEPFVRESFQDSFSENKVDDSSINLDFLNESADERIFYDFDANLRVLNKYTDKVKSYKITKTELLKIKGYNIKVYSCAKVDVFSVENDFAFLEISKNESILFKGWISNINKSISYPELRDLYITLDFCKKVD
ncbi:MAG: DUF2155 domain-containing protein [Proteobacteria bacterium]|nr:DUF2155 domain-containing protein [Pseudomonadota bacterium]